MKSQSVKFVSLISLCLLAIAMFVVGVWSVTAPSLNINGNVDMAVGTNALYIKDLRIKDADDPSDTGTTFENFDPGFVHNNIPVNLGRIDRTSSFVLLFDVVNTTTTYYMASTNSTVSGATLSAEGILMNSGISPTEAVTTSEISGTISLTVTLTSSSPVTLNNVVINFEETSGITVYSTDSTRGTGYATGVAMDGQTVTLNAEFTEDLEADFLGWRVGSATGEVISTLPEYTFTFNEGDPTTYYAEFESINNNLIYSYNYPEIGEATVDAAGSFTGTELTIPAMIYREGVSYEITGIGVIGSYNMSLSSVVIPETAREIYARAFENCMLGSIALPDSVETIGSRAFSNTMIQALRIPANLSDIGYGAFANCPGLVTIEVDENNLYYSTDGAVLYNKDFTELVLVPGGRSGLLIPSTVRSIDNLAFSGCRQLSQVMLPNSLQNINDGAFSDCTNLRSITIPASVTSIGVNPFAGCSNLTEISIATGGHFVVYDGALFNSARTELICMPAGFSGTFTVPSGTEKVLEEAFYGCVNLTSITITNRVQSIETRAFVECTNLDNVIIESSSVYQAVTNESACGGLISYATTITVPISIVESYNNSFLENGFRYSSSKNDTNYVFTKNP